MTLNSQTFKVRLNLLDTDCIYISDFFSILIFEIHFTTDIQKLYCASIDQGRTYFNVWTYFFKSMFLYKKTGKK